MELFEQNHSFFSHSKTWFCKTCHSCWAIVPADNSYSPFRKAWDHQLASSGLYAINSFKPIRQLLGVTKLELISTDWKQLRNLASKKKQIQRISQTRYFPLCFPFQKTYLWCCPWPCDSERTSSPSWAGDHRCVWLHHRVRQKSLSWILSGRVGQLFRLLQQGCKTSQILIMSVWTLL